MTLHLPPHREDIDNYTHLIVARGFQYHLAPRHPQRELYYFKRLTRMHGWSHGDHNTMAAKTGAENMRYSRCPLWFKQKQ